ncbi:MAG: hypothetical protein ACRCT6_04950, partial [Notoacmeibacter sp.]
MAGFNAFDPEDVDLFGSTSVMHSFLQSFGQKTVISPEHHQFRSMPYQRITIPNAKSIEVMGNLRVLTNGLWQPLVLQTRIPVSGFGAPLWIPSVEEQISVFELFGRPKDLEKAKILRSSDF